jgi:uncharacterized membrane protein YedE/YeeE
VELGLYSQSLIWFFAIALIFGAIANMANFCTMGAVSDWANFGDLNRMRSWVLAIAVTVVGVAVMEYLGIVDMSLTTSIDTSTPPYRFANFVWLRHLVGGLMFGIGMSIASGCGNKTLVRLGEGNLKSLVVLLMITSGASLMFFTSFDYVVFLQWMNPLSIDFAVMGAEGQDIGSILAMYLQTDDTATLKLLVPLAVGFTQLIWVFISRDFRQQKLLMFSGFVIGGLCLLGWYLTAGAQGVELIEEIDFMDQPPYASGAQSVTFIGPTAHLAQYLYSGFQFHYLSLGIVLLFGVVAGSFLYTLIFRKIRFEWFVSWDDFLRHVIGGLLMGIGGVLALGCTIGQGLTGFSTMAIGSFISVGGIVFAGMLTMKFQYYRMIHEDSSVFDAILTALADMHFLPGKMRRLEDL